MYLTLKYDGGETEHTKWCIRCDRDLSYGWGQSKSWSAEAVMRSLCGRRGVALEGCDHLEVEASYCVVTETCEMMNLPRCVSRSLRFVGKYMSVVIDI